MFTLKTDNHVSGEQCINQHEVGASRNKLSSCRQMLLGRVQEDEKPKLSCCLQRPLRSTGCPRLPCSEGKVGGGGSAAEGGVARSGWGGGGGGGGVKGGAASGKGLAAGRGGEPGGRGA